MFRIWFRTDGSIGRIDYAVGAIWYGLLAPAGLLLIVHGLRSLPLAPNLARVLLEGLVLAAAMLAGVHVLVSYVVVTVKRLRDLGQSGWWAVLLIVPGISWLLAFLVLSILPGARDRAARSTLGAPQSSAA